MPVGSARSSQSAETILADHTHAPAADTADDGAGDSGCNVNGSKVLALVQSEQHSVAFEVCDARKGHIIMSRTRTRDIVLP
jgi:hypothetical protein